MDLTSPEHDALVRAAVYHARTRNPAGVLALTDAIRRTDAERFTTEPASGTCTLVVDRWDYPQIVDRYETGRAAELDANRRNTRNIRDGQAHLRAALAVVERTDPVTACSCAPCTTPGRGHPGIEHCAACCGGSLIEEYDHGCPKAERREMAELQFPRRTAS